MIRASPLIHSSISIHQVGLNGLAPVLSKGTRLGFDTQLGDPVAIATSELFMLRDEAPDDEEFLYRVFASTRTDELALTGWSPEQQESFLRMQVAAQRYSYNTNYPEAQRSIILHKGEPAGRVFIDRNQREVHVVDIALLPEFRGKGIGSALMKLLMEEAAAGGKPLRLFVERFNPALRWYESMGFTRLSESQIYLEMTWRPKSAAAE